MAIRIIHIGTGSRGRHWIKIVHDYPHAISVGFVDNDPQALNEARKLAGRIPTNFYTDLSVALREVPADAALITSPSFLHAEHALVALESGLTVLTEKPFTTNLGDAHKVISKASAIGKHIIVAENYRFFAAERTIGRWLAEERIGRIGTVVCVDRRNQPPSEQGPWVATMEYPQLVEIAVHHFDSFRYMFHRDAVSIVARISNPNGSGYRSGAATEALIEMGGNLPILYLGSLTSHRYEYSLWIEGEKGSLWTDRKRVWWRKKASRFFLPVKLVSVPKGDEQPYPQAGTTSLLNQLRDAVLQNKEAETSGRDNFRTLAMVEAAMHSARERRKVSIAEVVNSGPSEAADVQMTTPVSGNGTSTTGKTGQKVSPIFSAKPRGSKPKTLVIGWDAADAELIEQWCAEGLLPNLARMKTRGTWSRMETPASMLHVSAWPSIFTGTTPDKHGLYHAYVARPGQQGPVRPRPDQSPVPFFWKLLSDRGKRCVVMDAFLTCPLQTFNGSQIVDWGSWSHFWETTVIPAKLNRQLDKKFGRYPAEDHSKVGMVPPSDFQGFRQRLLAGVAKKTEVVKWLMEKEDWDLFLVVFGESHPAGHYFWHFHDPSYLTHPEEGAGAMRHALRDIYIALDKAIGEILQNVDETTTVFLISGDGMGPNYSGSHILTDLLARMGLFKDTNTGVGKSDQKPAGANKPRQTKTDVLSVIRNMIPESLRIAVTKALLPRSVQEKLSLRWKTAGISWSQTRAFLIENSNEGYIRINLKGREPEGIVSAGAEYEKCRDEIYRTVQALVNPNNGKPAIRAIHKTDDIYNGPCRPQMPDIIINWNDDAKITTDLLTTQYGVAHAKVPSCAVPPYYTGNHRPNAFMVSLGPDIAQGTVCESSSILDIAPTILERYGVSQSEHMTGRVLTELRRVHEPEGRPVEVAFKATR